ncbi:hypothetical protein GGR52DRAFT_281312 [Hypoxylon sp. FL1284]|nr:hypothetical protein GGR52DRAFT_281312 [Hypoxylon sp. FL1284]
MLDRNKASCCLIHIILPAGSVIASLTCDIIVCLRCDPRSLAVRDLRSSNAISVQLCTSPRERRHGWRLYTWRAERAGISSQVFCGSVFTQQSQPRDEWNAVPHL